MQPSCFEDRKDMRDRVLSGRFTEREDKEIREVAAKVGLPVTLLVRTALMEWKARQASTSGEK
jgi:16S rRNA U516 pseudouridylate synthase RsuA-like enzyme